MFVQKKSPQWCLTQLPFKAGVRVWFNGLAVIGSILLLSVLSVTTAQAFALLDALLPGPVSIQIPTASHSGYVMARGLELGPNQQPMLVESDKNGDTIKEIGEMVGVYKDAFTLSGATYKSLIDSYNFYDQENRNGIGRGAKIVSSVVEEGQSASEYDSVCAALPPVMVAASSPDGAPQAKTIACPPINDEGIRTVVLRNAQTIIDPELLGPDGPILFRSAIDLRNIEASAVSKKSLLLSKTGSVLHQSDHTITFKWHYFKDGTTDRPGLGQFIDALHERVLSPIPGAKIQQSPFMGVNEYLTSNAHGGYRMKYHTIPCPCTARSYPGQIIADVPYRNFNPKTKGNSAYYSFHVKTPTYDFCSGYSSCPLIPALFLPSIIAIESTIAIPVIPRSDLRVSAIFLTGEGSIPVEVGDTQYSNERGDNSALNADELSYDFDGDRRTDKAVLYNDQYYVYLNGRDPEFVDGQPVNEDLRRQKDFNTDLEDRGLLTALSGEDLEQTDLYVYRVSTGQLILERIGLKREEWFTYKDGGTDEENTDSADFYYSLMMRGLGGSATVLGDSLETWWSKADVKLELFERHKADILRTGEQVQIVAINRATGYMGSVTAPIKLQTNNGRTSIDVPFEKLILRPPNLKVYAQRKPRSKLELAEEDIDLYTIGSEGAGLLSDNYIKITTEWFAHNGTPLPPDLPGYSAMIAKITSDNTLNEDAACGSQLNEIDIQPGVKPTLLKLKGGCDLSKEHYYLYFCGHNQASEGKDQCFNFKDSNGGRPDRYVPVKVAVFDEQATQQQDRLYRYGKEDGTIAANTAKPEPIYRWVYRPEMQFSVFGLTVNHINRVDDENQPQNIIDLTKQDTPSLTGGTDYVEVLYDILMNNDAPLTSFGPDRELVLALGEDEVKVIIGQDNKLKFNNIEHLALLDSKDLLTIRLYTNNDAGNILWEWAFDTEGLVIYSSDDEGSRANKSFIICDSAAQGRSICNKQQAITAELLVDASPTDTVVWKVEALEGNGATDDLDSSSNSSNKPFAYGKTKDWKMGQVAANITALTQSGTGRYQTPWISQSRPLLQAKFFSFRPDMSDERHTPSAYTSGGNAAFSINGTKQTDVWRHNPHVAYKVTATVNGQKTYDATVKMDEVDVLRQEYINHSVAATTNYLGLPERFKFKTKSSLPAVGEWGSSGTNAPYAYHYVQEDGMVRMWNTISTAFVAHRQNPYNSLTVPSHSLAVSSAFRNPERNERVSSATQSKHMMGRALDFYFTGSLGLPSDERAILFGSLWEMVEDGTGNSAQADFWQLERLGSSLKIKGQILLDENADGVPEEILSADHFHIQDNP